MPKTASPFLVSGAALSALAAMVHLGCIAFGAPWYRFLGAGEQMAQMALDGHWYPTLVTLFVAMVLSVWSLFALSGAGVIRKLPFLRSALCAITAVYLLRGVAFAPLIAYFPDNSLEFWAWSSAICFVIGAVHFVGLRQMWSRL